MSYTVKQIDLDGVNSYLIKGEGGFILIDTGGHLVLDRQYTNRRERLQAELKAAGCSRQDLRLIVLTHGDNDHACNAAYLKDRYQAEIAMHAGDLELVEVPTLQKCMESFQYHALLYRLVFRLMKKNIVQVTQRTLHDFERFSPDVLLEDGFSMAPYGLDAAVIHTPGHTNGSIAILTAEGDLFAGDTFTNVGKPASAPNAADFSRLSQSAERLKALPIKMVYPGHGNPFRFQML